LLRFVVVVVVDDDDGDDDEDDMSFDGSLRRYRTNTINLSQNWMNGPALKSGRRVGVDNAFELRGCNDGCRPGGPTRAPVVMSRVVPARSNFISTAGTAAVSHSGRDWWCQDARSSP